MNATNLVEKALRGALAGLLATLPMTLTMLALQRLRPPVKRALPPRRITMKLAGEAGIRPQLSPGARTAATYAAHFGYGAAAGAIYGLGREAAPGRPELKGIVFGLAVWTISYLGLLPAARILPPATKHAAGENALMIVAHVVWGGVLGWLAELRTPRRD